MFVLYLLVTFQVLRSTHAADLGKSDGIFPLIAIKTFRDGLTHPTSVEKVAPSRFANMVPSLFSQVTKLSFSSVGSADEIFLCPAEGREKQLIQKTNEILPDYITSKESEAVKDLKISEHCVTERPKSSNQDNLRPCNEEPVPLIFKEFDKGKNDQTEKIHCGRNNIGVRYAFEYQQCTFYSEKQLTQLHKLQKQSFKPIIPLSGLNYLETYEICYDHQNNETLFTTHYILAPQLLYTEELQNERGKDFPMMTEGYKYFDSEIFKNLKNVYTKAEEAKDDDRYVPEKLVPPNDMAFALWRKTTFHYINVKPLHIKLVPIWEYINTILQHYLIEEDYIYSQYTTTFEKLIRQDQQVFVYRDQIEVPKMWVKVVHSSKQGKGIAIILFNYFDEDIPKIFCTKNLCNFSYLKDIDENLYRVSHNVQCCPIARMVGELFHKNFGMVANLINLNWSRYHNEIFIAHRE